MDDTQLLNMEERKDKVRKLIGNLSDRFSEMFWNKPEVINRIKQFRPILLEEFGQRWDELDRRCKDYIDGKIDWEGDVLQMEFMPLTGAEFPRLEIDRDVANYGRDLLVWFFSQTKYL